jgi:hypothetical protein
MMVDVSKYRGARYIKLADVEKNPIEDWIADVSEGEYGLNLTFTNGATVTLNKTSVGNLADAWGEEADNWIAKRAKAYAGDIAYKGDFRRGVVVVPVSPPTEPNDDGKPFDVPF